MKGAQQRRRWHRHQHSSASDLRREACCDSLGRVSLIYAHLITRAESEVGGRRRAAAEATAATHPLLPVTLDACDRRSLTSALLYLSLFLCTRLASPLPFRLASVFILSFPRHLAQLSLGFLQASFACERVHSATAGDVPARMARRSERETSERK